MLLIKNFIKKLYQWILHKLSEVNGIEHLTIDNSLLARKANDIFIDSIVNCDKKKRLIKTILVNPGNG